MDEMKIAQTIQNAYNEPRAPEGLIRSVVLRAEAMTLGREARQQIARAPEAEQPELAARDILGQLAAVSPLPEGSDPRDLARQIAQSPEMVRAAEEGALPQRLADGSLLRQLAGEGAKPEQPRQEEPRAPQAESQPKLPGL